jgi:hypothetical protein
MWEIWEESEAVCHSSLSSSMVACHLLSTRGGALMIPYQLMNHLSQERVLHNSVPIKLASPSLYSYSDVQHTEVQYLFSMKLRLDWLQLKPDFHT